MITWDALHIEEGGERERERKSIFEYLHSKIEKAAITLTVFLKLARIWRLK